MTTCERGVQCELLRAGPTARYKAIGSFDPGFGSCFEVCRDDFFDDDDDDSLDGLDGLDDFDFDFDLSNRRINGDAAAEATQATAAAEATQATAAAEATQATAAAEATQATAAAAAHQEYDTDYYDTDCYYCPAPKVIECDDDGLALEMATTLDLWYSVVEGASLGSTFGRQVCAVFIGSHGYNIECLRAKHRESWWDIRVNHVFMRPEHCPRQDPGKWQYARLDIIAYCDALATDANSGRSFARLVEEVCSNLASAAHYVSNKMMLSNEAQHTKSDPIEVRACVTHHDRSIEEFAVWSSSSMFR